MPEREVIAGLPALLRKVRETAGLSQEQAAERAGVSRVSIARFETDARVPTLGVLYKLAEAYAVDVCDLLPKPTEPAPAPEPPKTKPKKEKK
jgi:transcriptional regulator with XRE-family HTH domain